MYLKLILLLIIYLKNIFNFKRKIFFKKNLLYKKGEYLSRISNCISCHTLNGNKPFSGGLSIKTNFGIINTPNISPNYKFGIGKWNFKNFYNSFKIGVNIKNKFLYPIFPYLNFSNLKKKDIKSIYFFIKNIEKVKIKNKLNRLNFPFKYKKLLLIWRIFFFKNFKNRIKISKIKERSKYLIKNLAHCEMCHNFINLFGNKFKKFKFLGNYINIEKWFSNQLNNNNILNIKKNIKNLTKILKFGFNKKNYIFGPMSEVINNSLQYISIVDLKLISIFIKNLFNKNKFFIKNYKTISKKNFKIFYKKGKILYKNYCKKCHGIKGFGKNYLFPSINNNFLNKIYINNIKNILFYNNKIKNNSFYKMPFFTNIKNKNIIYLINYIFILNKLWKNTFFKK